MGERNEGYSAEQKLHMDKHKWNRKMEKTWKSRHFKCIGMTLKLWRLGQIGLGRHGNVGLKVGKIKENSGTQSRFSLSLLWKYENFRVCRISVWHETGKCSPRVP